jgi:hypothetical protein
VIQTILAHLKQRAPLVAGPRRTQLNVRQNDLFAASFINTRHHAPTDYPFVFIQDSQHEQTMYSGDSRIFEPAYGEQVRSFLTNGNLYPPVCVEDVPVGASMPYSSPPLKVSNYFRPPFQLTLESPAIP